MGCFDASDVFMMSPCSSWDVDVEARRALSTKAGNVEIGNRVDAYLNWLVAESELVLVPPAEKGKARLLR